MRLIFRIPIFSIFLLASLLLVVTQADKAWALRVVSQQVILDELGDYELCQAKDYSGDWCHDALRRWVKEHPTDAFKAGKMTRKKMNHWAAIPFFVQAFEQNKGDCKDDDVKLAVISALNLPPSDNYVEVVAQAKALGMQKCFTEMKNAIADAATADSYLFKNVCKDLVAKGALSGLKKKKCEDAK